MCGAINLLVACLSSFLIVAIHTAPVTKNNIDDLKAALRSQLKDQEKALESLASLGKPGSNGIEYSKTKTFSYSNVNGAENKMEKAEEKVSEPETQKLLSDIKEEVKEERPSPEVKPLTSFKASLDIPSEGIHKEISEDGENQQDSFDVNQEQSSSEEGLGAMKETLEFTPRVVAEYLYRTGETQEFQNLLNELVESSEITSEEAEEYEKAVMDELYKLEQEQNTDIEELYQQGYSDDGRPIFPAYGAMQVPNDVYPLYGYGSNSAKVPQETADDYVNYMLNKPVTLDDMINTVIDTWLTNAIVNGDPEAEEILSNIVDYVSRDNDPNDEEQVKSILGDIFAEAILEDLAPRIEPQEVQIGENQLSIAQPNSEKEETAINEEKPSVEGTQTETAEQQNTQTSGVQSEVTQEEAKSSELKM